MRNKHAKGRMEMRDALAKEQLRMRHAAWGSAAFCLLWLFSAPAGAADNPCSGFRWDVGRERALFAGQAQALAAGTQVGGAPALAPGKLYELSLAPQEKVRFAAAPGKKMLADGASAGLVVLRVSEPGDYRVALDQGFWIDVVDDGHLIASKDFQGRPGCEAPHKIVLYTLPAGKPLVVQVSGGIGARLRVTVTPAATGSPQSQAPDRQMSP